MLPRLPVINSLCEYNTKWSLNDWKEIILIIMQAHGVEQGWNVLSNVTARINFYSCMMKIAWLDSQLLSLIQMICDDETFIDLSEGKDCGLFEVFTLLTMHDPIDLPSFQE